ncbi:hypothetical protein HD554DRAFT_2173094 [Boletus coccyginus]|nr:hypothetical protein HD554DRAFT_2173094 [Boletus coccyginus]
MLRLSRLPRARSLNVRFTTPGHANPLFLHRARSLDPAHPAHSTPLRNLPAFVCPLFAVRAFPFPLLHHPTDFVPINPLLATDRVRAPSDGQHSARQLADARAAALARRGRHNLSLLFHTSKKATSKSCVIRRRLRSKMTAAISLVVARNADAVEPASRSQLTLVSRATQGEPLVLQGWTYLVMPDLAIYKTPLPNLVQVVRKALLSLNHQSKRLEASWSAPPPCPPRVATKLSRTNHQPAKRPSISSRLYSDKPVILPRG